MKRKSASPGRERVTLRTIAHAAKVSLMAVSYALRNSPQVSARERTRIQGIAESLGYRPDPLLTHLMQHLRSHRTPKSATNLAVLTMLGAPFVRRLIAGAHARGERLGYHLDEIDVRAYLGKPDALTRMLQARGISGVLLAPTADPANYSGLLDWSRFAAVAMTYSIVEPHVHRVVTHHFDNAVRILSLLEEQGHTRIGLAMTHDMEFRSNHSYSGAYYRMTSMDGLKPLPLLYLDNASRAGIRAWFTRYRPDCVVVANSHQVRDFLFPCLTQRLRRQIAFRSLDHEINAGIPGIDQLFETIGSHAVDTLVAQIHRNERGLPENPTITMVKGRWIDT